MLSILVLSLSLVSSFAISSKYWEDNPLLASPGESVEFFIVLQNMAGEGGNITVEGSITEGANIAKFKDKLPTYTVPFGEKLSVYLTAEVPKEANNGEILDIVVSFRTISHDDTQALGLGSSIERTIPIKVVTEEKSFMWVWILVIATVALIIFILILKKKSTE